MKIYREYYWSEILFINGKTGIPIRFIQVHHLDENRKNNKPDNLYLCRRDYHYKSYHQKFWDFENDCFKSNWGQMSGWNKGLTKKNHEGIKKGGEKTSKTRKKRINSGEITFDCQKGDNSSTKRPEVRAKMSKSKKGKNNPKFNHNFVDNIVKAKNVYRWANIPFTKKDIAELLGMTKAQYHHINRDLSRRGLTWEEL
jgi:hypothetical protein